jgi:ADP-ribose pyrophosphatase YjhB (NUDIX family)
MFQHFLDAAKKEGITEYFIKLIIEKKDQILLLESGEMNRFYDFPFGKIKEKESMSSAIQRVSIETISLKIKNISRFLTFRDDESKGRYFYFIVEVFDPEDIFLREHHSYGWANPKDVFGYPIKEDLREILDLYIKIKPL